MSLAVTDLPGLRVHATRLRERLTGAPVIQLCQMQALRASSRTILARRPAGTRPTRRSGPSWFPSVQMTASTRWRIQFGNGRGCFSSLRAGGPDQGQAQVPAGEVLSGFRSGQVLVGDDDAAGSGPVRGPALQGLAGLVPFACQFGVREAEPGHRAAAGADQQLAVPYQRERLGQYAYPAYQSRSGCFVVTADFPHGIRGASIRRSCSAVAGVSSASQRRAASISGASCRFQVTDPVRRSRGASPPPATNPGQRSRTRPGRPR